MSNGGVNTLTLTFTNPDGSLFPITGLTWEYVARRDASDVVTASVIQVTTTPNSQGVISVNTGTSQVTVTLYPAATLNLPARAVYAHTLWSDPGNSTSATAWIYGGLVINQVAQP